MTAKDASRAPRPQPQPQPQPQQPQPQQQQQPRPLWAVWLSCMLALAASALLVLADGLAGVMGSWDTPAPGLGWIKVAVAGHCVLAICSVMLLVSGLHRAAWRRTAAIAAWMVIGVGVGWFLLAGRLASGA